MHSQWGPDRLEEALCVFLKVPHYVSLKRTFYDHPEVFDPCSEERYYTYTWQNWTTLLRLGESWLALQRIRNLCTSAPRQNLMWQVELRMYLTAFVTSLLATLDALAGEIRYMPGVEEDPKRRSKRRPAFRKGVEEDPERRPAFRKRAMSKWKWPEGSEAIRDKALKATEETWFKELKSYRDLWVHQEGKFLYVGYLIGTENDKPRFYPPPVRTVRYNLSTSRLWTLFSHAPGVAGGSTIRPTDFLYPEFSLDELCDHYWNHVRDLVNEMWDLLRQYFMKHL